MNRVSFKTVNHRLVHVSYNINESFDFNNTASVPVDLSISRNISQHDTKPRADVTITVSLYKDTENSPMQCEVVYRGLFAWDADSYSTEKLQTLLMCNAPALLFSYVRPIITQLTTLSALPPLTLPFINFFDEDSDHIQKE